MATDADYCDRINAILGGDAFAASEFSTVFHLENHADALGALAKIREMQRQLREVKRDISADISQMKSEIATAKANIGTGGSNFIASVFLGRRTVGKLHAIERDSLRQRSAHLAAPLQAIKVKIDHFCSQLDSAKDQIKASEAYAIKSSSSRKTASVPAVQYYAYISGQVKGPFTFDQLSALALAGTIDAFTQVCVAGTEIWRRYSDISV